MAIYLGNTKIADTSAQSALTVDAALSGVSTHPVQNQAIYAKLAALAPYVQSAALRDMNEQTVVNAADVLSATGDLHALELDLSKNGQLTQLTAKGTSGSLANLSGVLVSNKAPFNHATAPQIDVSYSNLNRTDLVNLFDSMPYNVGYTTVGSPTISGGIASGFVGRSAYLELSDSITYSSSSNLKIHIKFKTGTLTAVRAPIIQCDNMGGNSLLYTYGSYLYCMPYAGISDVIYTDTQSNTWYSVDIAVNNDTTECKLYNASGTLLATKTFTSQFSSVTYRFYFGLQYGYDPEDLLVVDSIDLNEIYVGLNNIAWFMGQAAMTKTCDVRGCTGTSDLTAQDKAIATDKGWSLTVA